MFASTSARAADVEASVNNVGSAKGHVVCAIFGSSQGFPKDMQKALKYVRIPATLPGVTCSFPGLAAGRYAISVLHDENDDGIMNTNLLGIPREGYGVSNNRTYATKAPNFEESQFVVETAPVALDINLKY